MLLELASLVTMIHVKVIHVITYTSSFPFLLLSRLLLHGWTMVYPLTS